MKCPDDGRDLDAGGACPMCRGRLLEAHAARARWPDVKLATETRLDSPAFKRTRLCPTCEAPMAPLRIGDQQAWVERCPGCDHLLGRRPGPAGLRPPPAPRPPRGRGGLAARRGTRELATGLAAATAGGPRQISPFHQALAWVGLPVVENVDGDKRLLGHLRPRRGAPRGVPPGAPRPPGLRRRPRRPLARADRRLRSLRLAAPARQRLLPGGLRRRGGAAAPPPCSSSPSSWSRGWSPPLPRARWRRRGRPSAGPAARWRR